jgi:hypothetical protein
MGAPKGNKFAIGNTGGRPPAYETPEELEKECIKYFQYCVDEQEKATITGLTLFLGFCSRSSLVDYAKKKEFTHILKRAKLTVEHSYEMTGNTIDIFALKQMGWTDKQELQHSGEINSNLSSLSTEELLKRAEAIKTINKNKK